MMVRNDGKYIIFILQFIDRQDKEWCYSGDCDQWLPKNLSREEWEGYVFTGIFRPLGANGDCWQKTGIQGTFSRNEAIQVMHKLAEWHPNRAFRVCELRIEQKTIPITEARYPNELSG